MNNRYPERKLSILHKLVITAAAAAIFAPVLLAAYYRSIFGYHWLVVLFGASALIFVLAAIALVTVIINARFTQKADRLTAWFCGLTAGIAIVAFCGIYVATFASHSAWGDAVSLSLVRTFIFYPSSALSFLPVSDDYKTSLLYQVAAAITLGLIIIVGLLLTLSRHIVKMLRQRTSVTDNKTKSNTGLIAALAITGAVSAGFCAIVLSTHKPLLAGEPLSAFLELLPTSRLMGPDNARLIAATEDRDARLRYERPASFKPRNVILIVADALRADRMSVYGYERPTTPFLSGLFASKLLHRVDMALSTCSETYCSVASTLASRPFHEISPINFKLHSLLRDVGYRINFFLSGDHRTWSYLNEFYGSDVDAVYDFLTLRPRDMHDDRNLIAALEDVPASTGAPNFFYFFLMSSHVNGPKLPEFNRFKPSFSDNMRLLTFWNELAGAQRVNLNETVKSRLTSKDLEAVSNRYDNGVLQTDSMIMKIFDALMKKGYLDDSIVVIIGDHGDGLGEHGHVGHTRYLYQGDIRVPLLIYENVLSDYKNGVYATQIDVAPTIVDRLGLKVPGGWRGKSLLKPPSDRITIHQTRRGHSPCFAVVERTSSKLMKYIRCGTGENITEELFDVAADPHERTNLMGQADAAALRRYRREIDSRFAIVTNSCTAIECRD